LEIKDKKGIENSVAVHLSRIKTDLKEHVQLIDDSFVEEHMYHLNALHVPWYADLVNFHACGIIPPELTYQQRRKFLVDAKHYFWDEPFLFKLGVDGIHRRCISDEEISSILFHCHSSSYGGHASTDKTAAKVLQSGFFSPTLFKNTRNFVMSCDRC
jgi:Integrase zinc binding domain